MGCPGEAGSGPDTEPTHADAQAGENAAAAPDGIAARFLQGDRRALARALSWVENRDPRGERVLRAVVRGPRRAHVIGITGSPGVGKSTLVDRLTVELRKETVPLGVLAVDPSSPFSGGAILGDRIRMAQGALDPGVFVRSLATRGRVGGLSAATGDAIRLMDAFGKQMVLLETVGAGQAEVEVMALADTVLVVLAPGLGDDVQAIKAGILEIADILVVNKGDRPGADLTVREMRQMLMLGRAAPAEGEAPRWSVPVVRVSALTGDGFPVLLENLRSHMEALDASGSLARRRGMEAERALRDALADRYLRRLLAHVGDIRWTKTVADLAEGRMSVEEAAEAVSGDGQPRR